MKMMATVLMTACLALSTGGALAADTMEKPAATTAQKGPTPKECRAYRAAVKKDPSKKDEAKTTSCLALLKKREADITKNAPVDPTKR